MEFYCRLYTEDEVSRPFIEVVDWQPIAHAKVEYIGRQFEEEEVWKAIWAMLTEKFLGPDGFMGAFFQSY